MAESEMPGLSQATSFSSWVKENGGDEEFVSILVDHGFKSKLSLSFVDVSSPEGKALLQQLNYGEKCLLQGLIKLSSQGRSGTSKDDPYSKSIGRAQILKQKAEPLKQKLSSLFHFGSGSSSCSSKTLKQEEADPDSDEPFQPLPSYRQSRDRKRGKRSSSYSLSPLRKRGKGSKKPSMVKVKECRLKVTALPRPTTSVPPPRNREQWTRDVWIRVAASETEITAKIQQAFSWKTSDQPQYMYAQGKNLRPATLCDIEGADSWDLETVRALMGNGSLYVLHGENPSQTCPNTEGEVVSDKPDYQENLLRLKDIFKKTPEEKIETLLRQHGMQGALDRLVDEISRELRNPPQSEHNIEVSPKHHSEDCEACQTPVLQTSIHMPSGVDVNVVQLPSPVPTPTSQNPTTDSDVVIVEPDNVGQLLRCHAEKVLNMSSEHTLCVDRSVADRFWASVVAFYKSTMSRPNKLKKQLVIQFEGEMGADAGALRREFYEDAIKEADARLFEGDDVQRMPKKDYPLAILLEITGMLIAHSLLQEGPGFPCLSEAVYTYLLRGRVDECYPTKEDISLNLSTHELLTLIDNLDEAETDDDIDSLFDAPSTLSIINNSSWSITEPVTITNKSSLLQRLILEEVIIRREGNLQAFRRGLDHLKIIDLIVAYPKLMKPLFVSIPQPLTAEKVWSLVASLKPQDPKQQQAYGFYNEFLEYIEAHQEVLGSEVSLPALLRFITGVSAVPPMGLSHPIQLIYQPEEESATFLKAQACTSTVFLPVVHNSKEAFFDACAKSLQYGSGFGLS